MRRSDANQQVWHLDLFDKCTEAKLLADHSATRSMRPAAVPGFAELPAESAPAHRHACKCGQARRRSAKRTYARRAPRDRLEDGFRGLKV